MDKKFNIHNSGGNSTRKEKSWVEIPFQFALVLQSVDIAQDEGTPCLTGMQFTLHKIFSIAMY